MNTWSDKTTGSAIAKVITSTKMRQHWLKGNVKQLTPLTDVIVTFAGHWWNLDGDDAWVRVTDQNLIAVYERQHERWRAADQELQRRIKR